MQLLKYTVSILTAKQYHPSGVEKVTENLIEIRRNTVFAGVFAWVFLRISSKQKHPKQNTKIR